MQNVRRRAAALSRQAFADAERRAPQLELSPCFLIRTFAFVVLLDGSSQGCNLHTAPLNPELTQAVSIIRLIGCGAVRPSATILSPPSLTPTKMSAGNLLSTPGTSFHEYGDFLCKAQCQRCCYFLLAPNL